MSEQELRDRRIDRAMSWGLSTIVAVSMSVAAFFFRDLNASVNELRDSVADLRAEVAVLRARREQVDELKASLREVLSRLRTLEARR